MRKITLLMAVLAVSTYMSAATGWFNDFLTIKVDGVETANNYYIGTDPATGATALQGKVFGTVTSLQISGCDMKYWSDTQDRTGGAFYYKIMDASNTIELVAGTEIIWDQASLGGNDYQGTKTPSVDLLAGLPYGNYQLHVWAKSWGTGQGDNWLSNSGVNYVATFTKAAPATPLSGTYKVGTKLNSDFALLSTAVAAINTNGISGNVSLLITSDITEAANVGLGVNTNGFNITIRPDADANRTITFTQLADNTSPTGHFVIGYPSSGLTVAWSDANTIATSNVTIDGYAVGGSTRRLVFTNTNANHINARMIVVVGACQNTVVKNCVINNLTTSTGSPFCVGAVVRKGTAIEVAPTTLVVENNVLTATASGVGMGMRITNSGTLVAVPKISGFVFRDNTITASRRLLELSYLTGNSEIYNNTFTLRQATAAGALIYGIFGNTGLLGTVNLYNNKFVEASLVESAASGTYGIRLVSLASGPTWNIYNNTFAGINRNQTAGAATLNLSYIQVSFGTANIYNNSFYMPALTSPTALGYYNAINNSNAQNAQKIKNNVFLSDESVASCVFVSNVCVSPGESDYNVFYHRKSNSNAKYIATYATLADYKGANTTLDINSKSVDVNFENAATGDLRIASASYQDANLQVVRLTEVPKDIFGTDRDYYTYAGAHQAQSFIVNGNATPEVSARIMRTASGIEVQLDSEATVELYNMNGMIIDKVVTSGTYSRDLNNGVYIIRINGKATKFIK